MILRRDPPINISSVPSVREALRRDVPALMALWNEMMEFHSGIDPRFKISGNYHRELERHFVESMRSGVSRLFVMELEGKIVGYILGELHQRKPIYPAGNYGFISDLCVSSEYRRRGFGRKLVEELMQWFESRKVNSIELFLLEANPTSTAFWSTLGFGNYLRLVRKDLK